MSRRTLPLVLAIVALCATGVSLSAKSKSDSNAAVSTKITLTAKTTVGSSQLAPGDYKVVVEGNQAKFEQGNKTVAQVPATVKDMSGKVQQTQFVMEGDHISEIQIGGSNKAIDLGQ